MHAFLCYRRGRVQDAALKLCVICTESLGAVPHSLADVLHPFADVLHPRENTIRFSVLSGDEILPPSFLRLRLLLRNLSVDALQLSLQFLLFLPLHLYFPLQLLDFPLDVMDTR